jgi:N-acetylglucosaminyldiphosphoundecaprenol N-acetyl-beta-D-mannosaminyltransferase
MSTELQHSVAVMGLPLANLTEDEAVDQIERLILSGGSHQVATANLDFWLNSLRDVSLHRILAGCSLVLPDGMPLVWISRMLGKPLKQRVSGADLLPMLAALSAKKGYRIFLLGGKPGVGARCAEVLEGLYPGVKIAGHYSPPLADLERMDHGDTLQRIHTAKPDILMVAFGNPKQEKWIRMHLKRLGVPVSIGIGGSMDMLIGDVKRAPKWMQQSGLEWLGRCFQEPKRLLPRYWGNAKALAVRLPLALSVAALQRPARSSSSITLRNEMGMVHLSVEGNLDAGIANILDRTVDGCIEGSQLLVLHLTELKYATPSGLGALLDARQRLLSMGLSLTLAGVPLRMKVLFSAWCLEPLFDEFRIERERFAVARANARAAGFGLLPKQPEISKVKV